MNVISQKVYEGIFKLEITQTVAYTGIRTCIMNIYIYIFIVNYKRVIQ